MAFVLLCAAADIPSGEMRRVDAAGLELACYHVGERSYVTSAICTHERADLTGGRLEGGVVTCPLHGARFDVSTGRVLRPPAHEPLKIYAVRLRDGRVEADLPS